MPAPEPTAPAVLLSVTDLSVTFRSERGPLRALDGVSLDIAEREVVSIVGESGSGKTLTAMSIMGLINDPNAELAGSIRFEGRELIGLPRRAWTTLRGRRIAMIFQDPMTALTPVYTIGQQIGEQLRVHTDLSRRAARARAIELLGEMGMPNPRVQVDRYPHQMSGGMRQRAVIAMALSCNPSLLLADEPTTALDVTVQAQILQLLRRLRENFGSAIVLITHDMGVVAEIADRVLVMYAGRIVESGRRGDVFARPGHPYTMGLLDSIPPIRGARPRRLPSITGSPPMIGRLPAGCPFQPRCQHAHATCVERPRLIRRDDQAFACWLAEEREAWPPPRRTPSDAALDAA
jgi:peptide/nickel transport system ATP-binding protein